MCEASLGRVPGWQVSLEWGSQKRDLARWGCLKNGSLGARRSGGGGTGGKGGRLESGKGCAWAKVLGRWGFEGSMGTLGQEY